MLNIGLLADYRPFNGVFGLVGGIYKCYNNITMKRDNIDMKISIGDISPYFGITFSKGINKKGFGFNLNMGALYTGYPVLTTNVDGLNKDVDKELAQLRKQIAVTPVLPIVTIGVSYTF
jgi:hypothetical protein